MLQFILSVSNMKSTQGVENSLRLPATQGYSRAIILACLCIFPVVAGFTPSLRVTNTQAAYQCHPPLPTLLSSNPPTIDNQAISSATARLDAYLSTIANRTDVESLVVAVGTSAGPLWSKGYGVARANESSSGSPDLDTIYRIASVSKMFTALETMLLRDQRALSLYVNIFVDTASETYRFLLF